MIFVTTYELKPHQNKSEIKELMDVFASEGSMPGTIAHYVNGDGGGGVVIAESDDIAAAYRNLINYTEWMTFETKVMLDIEDAVPLIADHVG